MAKHTTVEFDPELPAEVRKVLQRTTVELDPEQLAAARKVLGTTGVKDTIDAAFDQIVRQAKRMEMLEMLRDPECFDFSEEVFRQARPRVP